MFRLSPAFFFVLSFSSAVLAQDPSPSGEATIESKVKSKKETRNGKASGAKKLLKTKDAGVESGESLPADNVSGKAPSYTSRKFGVGLNGGFVYLSGGAGLEGWYSASKKLDLSFRAVGSSAKIAASGDAYYLETAQITMVQLGAHARYFFGNSFYALGGLGYNTYTGSYGVTVNSTKEEFLLPMKASALSLDLAIGNMWKWDSGFTLGFDWIGYSNFMGMTLKLDDPQTDQEKSVFTDFRTIPGGGDPTEKAKALITKNNIYFLMMTIGYAF